METKLLNSKVCISALATAIILLGCKTNPKVLTQEVEFQHEAASFNMAVTMVAPWDQFSKSLSPGFKLSGDSALEKVIPTTSAIQEIDITNSGTSLKFGLPTRSSTKTKASTDTDGVETETTNEESTSGPGTLPTNDVTLPANEATFTAAGSDGLTASDPLLQYSAATALFQEVQLLNQYVNNVALREKVTPFVVRIQLGVLPYKRNLPYDVYMTLGFFPKLVCKEKPQPVATHASGDEVTSGKGNGTVTSCPNTKPYYPQPAFAVPLLVTDSLEGALSTRTEEIKKQLGIAISLLNDNLAGSFGFNRGTSDIDNFVGTDLNSTFTIGRISDGALQLRLGAKRLSTNSHIMIPRNHHMTLLLMVPNDAFKHTGFTKIDSSTLVAVRAYTRLRHADGKNDPKQRNRNLEFDSLAKSILPRYLEKDSIKSQKSECAGMTDGTEVNLSTQNTNEVTCIRNVVEKLQNLVIGNNISEFFTYAEAIGIEDRRREVWLKFADELSRREFLGHTFQLPNLREIRLPPVSNSLVVTNDGKQLKLSIPGGSGLEASQLSLFLEVQSTSTGASSNTFGYSASSISTSSNGSTINASFTSPDSLGVTNWKAAKLKITHKPDRYGNKRIDCPRAAQARCNKIEFSRLLKTKVPTPKVKAIFTFTSTVKTITPDKDGKGEITVHLEAKKVNNKLPLNSANLVVSNASVENASATDAQGNSVANPKISFGKVVAMPNTSITIKLKNLNLGSTVTIAPKGLKGNKAIKGSPPSLNFDIKK